MMQISELIEGLQEIREAHGDLGVSLAVRWSSADRQYEACGELDLGILVTEGDALLWGRAAGVPRQIPSDRKEE